MTFARVTLPVEEGATVSFVRASLGERAGAFSIDVAMVVLAVALASGACGCLGSIGGFAFEWGLTVYVLFVFFSVFLWFAWCESGRRGATPGKRLLHLRVVDRRGLVLTPQAAFARNVIRWFELAGPLALLFSGGEADIDGTSWASVAQVIGLCGFAATPFVRRDGLRLGDLIADTMVVRAPRAALRGELTKTADAALVFADHELDIYGERELHALEALLRAGGTGFGARARLGAAATVIAGKIGRAAPPPIASEAWLRAFYAAQRARLERRLAFGRRKADKHQSG